MPVSSVGCLFKLGFKIMKTVFVAGHRGMVGAAIVRHLEQRGEVNIITCTRNELD